MGNGYCNGINNIKECDYDGGDCCLKEACKIKTIKKCDDGEACTTFTEQPTCTDKSGVADTCDCIDPAVRKFTNKLYIQLLESDYIRLLNKPHVNGVSLRKSNL